MTLRSPVRLALAAALLVATLSLPVAAQRGFGGFGQNPQDSNLPENPTAVTVAGISEAITGPGSIYESVQSLPPGMGLDHFGYEAREYFVSGTAAGEPYKTRIIVRRPADDADFSGLVLAEAMHPSGSAHIFEFTSNYLMDSGHAAVEIVVSGLNVLEEHNPERYGDISVTGGQVSEVLAQVGALIKEGNESPLADLEVRKMVLGGTSATAAILIRYLPGHMVYRTPGMQRIFDGFMPHSTGATIRPVDVPLIQVPTMTEVAGGNSTPRQDGDTPGDQYRLYEFAGMAHVDTRDSVRFKPDPCRYPSSRFPLQAYLSVALNHLFRWVDEGVVPPRAPRILVDRNVSNDGSLMALDRYGNAIGGIRNPYVEVPIAKLGVRNEGADPLIENPSEWIAARGQAGANQMCSLGGYQTPLSKQTLEMLYGSPAAYLAQVRAQLDQMEAAGWSLPVYREMILADAAKVGF